ncbi:hypothetical protein [Bradyrhizobium sp. SZCCHNR1098]|uniref:hypothetical protein n=1 Tax=Bradyrhizobium sp. SZCCHNR1098 TaxID=3057370 RepID=UPI00291681FD|nr:hypothetical protein [Bradyrhizobium sp. SZCCHNR1098]
MSDASIIAEGKAAWQRLKDQSRATFADWVAIGRALQAARRECMARARVNAPFGSSYQKHMRDWLREAGMADLDNHERYNAVLMVEHLGEIEAYRATLSEAERMRCNHPNTVLVHWRRGSAPTAKPGPKPIRHVVEHKDRNARAQRDEHVERPGESMIRRVALAMKVSGRQDYFSLAAIAIETLTRADLMELLGEKDRAPAQSLEQTYGQHVLA